MANDNWRPFQEVDFSDVSLNTFHVDTRDFHCIAHKDANGEPPDKRHVSHMKEQFWYSVEEVRELLTRLFNESGGGVGWRMLCLKGPGAKKLAGSAWQLKYIRIYRDDDMFLVCNSYRQALSKQVMSHPVNQEYLNAH